MSNLRKLVPEDLYQFVIVSDPRITPDGELIAYVRTHIDKDSNEPRSAIWCVAAAGGTPFQFTQGPKSDHSPRWSPDGRILAFVSNRGGESQIYLIDRYGGEARPLTQMRHGATGPVWSPDGRRIAFCSGAGLDESHELLTRRKSDEQRQAEEKKAKDEARIFTRAGWRSDAEGILPDRRNQIWVVDVPAPGEPLPTPIQITWGDFDHYAPFWSPDGQLISFSAWRSDDELAPLRDVFVTPVPGPNAEYNPAEAAAAFAPVCLTKGTGDYFGGPFSPDGAWVAVLGHQNEFDNATQPRIWLFPVTGGEPRVLDHWDLSLGDSVGADVRPGGSGVELTWAPDGNLIYVSVTERGACSVYSFPTVGGRPQLVAGGDREIFGGTFDANCEVLAFVAGDMRSISDIYVMDCREYAETRLTDVNRDLFAQLRLPEVTEISFSARDGLPLHGWLMKPVDFAPEERYPLVLDVHGGPHTCFGHAFFQESQLFAAAGYGVLFINPRGSTGYGQAFANAVCGDYGHKDYEDLMDAVDFALAQGWVDEKRLAVTGGSYGGFMTNWIVGQTDRFAVAASHRSISNWVSFSGTPDFGPVFNQMEHKVADPWSEEGVQALWRVSPLAYAKNVTTPLALFHSEFDYRCPIEQAEQFYMALKFYGRAPTQLIRHPRSNHDLTRLGPPVLRVDRFHKMLDWFQRYCPPNPAAASECEA